MLDAILIRDVTLPQTLRTAIEQKLKQEQESLEYEFKIDKARKEAERKEIEAKGTRQDCNHFKELLSKEEVQGQQRLLQLEKCQVVQELKEYFHLDLLF